MSIAKSRNGAAPKSVLITTDCIGGIWNYAVQLTRGLTVRGVEVLIAALGPAPTASQRQEIQSIDGCYLAHLDCRLEWMDGGCEDLESCGSWLRCLEESFRPDIIHSNSYGLARTPFCAPILVVAHSCVYSWWRAVHGASPPKEWSTYRSAVAQGLSSAAAVIAPTHAMLRSLAGNYDVNLSNSRVIHNSCQIPEVNPLIKRPMILAAGRVWDESKNFAVLDKIAPHLPCSIRIAGAIQSPEGHRGFHARNVSLLGAISQGELHRLMYRSTVFAHPALYEPFGLAVLEAARCGCALVLSDIPSLRELWADAALFCPPDDEEAWSKALKIMLNNDRLCANFSQRARSRAAQFSTEGMVSEYQDLYRRMIANHSRDAHWERAS